MHTVVHQGVSSRCIPSQIPHIPAFFPVFVSIQTSAPTCSAQKRKVTPMRLWRLRLHGASELPNIYNNGGIEVNQPPKGQGASPEQPCMQTQKKEPPNHPDPRTRSPAFQKKMGKGMYLEAGSEQRECSRDRDDRGGNWRASIIAQTRSAK